MGHNLEKAKNWNFQSCLWSFRFDACCPLVSLLNRSMVPELCYMLQSWRVVIFSSNKKCNKNRQLTPTNCCMLWQEKNIVTNHLSKNNYIQDNDLHANMSFCVTMSLLDTCLRAIKILNRRCNFSTSSWLCNMGLISKKELKTGGEP